MLVSFSVSNFRSFGAEQTFSMVASTRVAANHEDHTLAIPDSDKKVLKTAVIYGANGAGKSNLFKALQYLRNLALKPKKKNTGTGREAFCFYTDKTQLSAFDLQFIANNKLYRYGVTLDDERIVEEWLVRVKGSREQILYERALDKNGNVKIKSLKKAGEKLKALGTVGSPHNQSFLAAIQANLEPEDYPELDEVIQWFEDNLNLVSPDSSFSHLGSLLEDNPEFLSFAGAFLNAASTGVGKLAVQKSEISEDELKSLFPKKFISSVLDDANGYSGNTMTVPLGNNKELLIERTDANHFFRLTIQAEHAHPDGLNVKLDLDEESDGTKRLLNLLPALHYLQTGNAVFFIDEIDRSMHPMLSKQFLEFFLKSCNSGQHQIIVTTHESNLLDLDLLRRDEIWFTEKDATGATHLYSLTDFKVRNDLDIRKGYLQGRFGAIPFLGNLESLLPQRQIPDGA